MKSRMMVITASLLISLSGGLISAIAQDDLFFRKPWNPEGFKPYLGYAKPGYGQIHAGVDVDNLDRLAITTALGKVVVIQPLCNLKHEHGPGKGCLDKGFGNTVIIEHELEEGDKIYSLYAHLEKIDSDIKEGTRASGNQVIGKMGASRYGMLRDSSIPIHLHFEVKDKPIIGPPWGYVPAGTNPDDYGYHNPYNFFGKRKVKKVEEGPVIPYEDYGACPGEGCTYGERVALKDTSIYRDRDEKSAVVFVVKKGERVQNETGVVVTLVAGKTEVLRDTILGRDYIPWRSQKTHYQFQKGDVLYLLTYLGEGFWKVWYRGELIELSFPIITRPGKEGMLKESRDFKLIQENKSVWWLKIRNRKGEVGWTKDWRNFRSAQPGPLE